ncbi:DUF4261 domain-containing protein [Aeoliella sp. ICT_H6.2]|uniref:DUF4261 domain-containing protein n=1 Tax=Aeoliella straminimaris TaxID=2954799 RepID=A0A9X2FIF9_9BACT|nr:DUF4261 domain-containing protein [Aeoliella straminimaris]MCO6047794.1 DUF4261 domain-containing protein [Aeoliella straminimaris]
MQAVEFHFHEPPIIDFEAVRQRASEILGGEIEMPASEKDNAHLFAHVEHMIEYADRAAPPQTWLLQSDQPIKIENYAADIQQSWFCRDAESLLAGATHSLLVTEMLSRRLEPATRMQLFHGVLQAVAEQLEPVAMVAKHSQQVVLVSDYLDAVDVPPIKRPGSLNMRFFNISNTPGDKLMDTRGLTEIGLHDLQCHFRELEPNDVSAVLYNTAMYVFEKGLVLESGHTVEGIEPGSKWRCQFENALVPPERQVLDLNPGAPYAAGRREE